MAGRTPVSSSMRSAEVVISSTNMIFFNSSYPMDNIVNAFRKKGVLFLKEGEMGRIVLSLNINDEDTDAIVKIIDSTSIEEFS